MAPLDFPPPPDICVGTRQGPFKPTVFPESGIDGKFQRCEHISFQTEHKAFSPEELRLKDYEHEEKLYRARQEWSVQTHYRLKPADSPPQLPRVRLPMLSGGVISIDAVTKLQDELEKINLEMKELQYAMEIATGRGVEHGLSLGQIRKFLESNPIVHDLLSANVKKKVAIETEVATSSIIARYEAKLEIVADLIKTESEKRLKEDTAHITAACEEKMKIAAERADILQTQAILTAEKRPPSKINLAENRARAADTKLKMVEKASQDTPNAGVKLVWDQISQAIKSVGPMVEPNVASGVLFNQFVKWQEAGGFPAENAQVPNIFGSASKVLTQAPNPQHTTPFTRSALLVPSTPTKPLTGPAKRDRDTDDAGGKLKKTRTG